MNKITRKEREILRKLANELPQTYYEANEKFILSGLEILKDPSIKTNNFNGPIIPNKKYEIARKVMKPVNHNNRLITAFESGGLEAVDKYCIEVHELVYGSIEPIPLNETNNTFSEC